MSRCTGSTSRTPRVSLRVLASSSEATDILKSAGARRVSLPADCGPLSIPNGTAISELFRLGELGEMKKGRIVRYTLEEIKERRKKGLSKTDWDRINAMTDEEIERNAIEDDRIHGFPEDWGEARWVEGIGKNERRPEDEQSE